MIHPVEAPGRQTLLAIPPEPLRAWLEQRGHRTFHADQIARWIYERGVRSFEEMSDLSQRLRRELADAFDIYQADEARRAESNDGTVKWLLRWADGETSECVLIPGDRRMTACVSSQVGCPAQCRFCASGVGGLRRNLSASEIVEQALRVAAGAVAGGHRLSHVVFMGLGEPLANYDAVMQAIRVINAPWGLNIGARKITVSTVGLPKMIRRLAGEGLQIQLALSLHAPTDAARRELIPWAERISLVELTDAGRHYFEKTGREITLEYILLADVNDRPEDARQLAAFTRGLRCNVNLLRYNPVEGLPYSRPTSEQSHGFAEMLRRHGVNAHIRTSRGLDIDAACGQLRRQDMADAVEAAAPVNIS
jgi:23S rRNA (adenine2503-C2)-methyltransferase